MALLRIGGIHSGRKREELLSSYDGEEPYMPGGYETPYDGEEPYMPNGYDSSDDDYDDGYDGDYGYDDAYGDDGDYVTVRSGGEYSLVLHRNLYPKITGVSVACRGGNDAEIRKKLIDVISTALGVSSNRICIVGTK